MKWTHKGLLVATLAGSILLQPAASHASNTDAQAELLKQIIQKQLVAVTKTGNTNSPPVKEAKMVKNCRNTQITSYAPVAGSHTDTVSLIEYFVTANTKISSLEAQVNGKDLPVQYVQLGDGSYRAKVVLPNEMQGSLFVSLGAGSTRSGACNSLLYTSMVVGHNYDEFGNKVAVTTTGKKSKVATTGGSLASAGQKVLVANKINNTSGVVSKTSVTGDDLFAADEELSLGNSESPKAVTVIANESKSWWDTVQGWFGGSSNDTEVAAVTQSHNEPGNKPDRQIDGADLVDSDSVLAQEQTDLATSAVALNNEITDIESDEVAVENNQDSNLQQATVIGSVGAAASSLGSGLLGRSCSTIGSALPWYVWLGLMWLWLVAVWVLVSTLSERLVGSAYQQRLPWVMLSLVVGGSLVWWLMNPCYSNAWVPVSLVLLGGVMYWLYSEEDASVATQ